MLLSLKPLFQRIYFEDILIPAAEREQDVFDTILEKLKKNISQEPKLILKIESILISIPVKLVKAYQCTKSL